MWNEHENDFEWQFVQYQTILFVIYIYIPEIYYEKKIYAYIYLSLYLHDPQTLTFHYNGEYFLLFALIDLIYQEYTYLLCVQITLPT